MREHDSLVNLSGLLAQPKVLEAEAGKLQRSISWETMVSRGARGFRQYGLYFLVMWAGGLKYPERANLIRSGNFYWRWVDDIADSDRPLPEKYANEKEFLEGRRDVATKLFFSVRQNVWGDREDILLAHYHYLSSRLGIDLVKESFDILDTIMWDEERARHKKVLNQGELDANLGKLDIACVSGGLKVAEERCTAQDLESLSWAVRTMFNLRDFPKDYARGLINISAEDIEGYEIDLAKIDGRNFEELVAYDPMRRWYQVKVREGLRFLNLARADLAGLHLKWITRTVINLNFLGSAGRNLNKYAKMLRV